MKFDRNQLEMIRHEKKQRMKKGHIRQTYAGFCRTVFQNSVQTSSHIARHLESSSDQNVEFENVESQLAKLLLIQPRAGFRKVSKKRHL